MMLFNARKVADSFDFQIIFAIVSLTLSKRSNSSIAAGVRELEPSSGRGSSSSRIFRVPPVRLWLTARAHECTHMQVCACFFDMLCTYECTHMQTIYMMHSACNECYCVPSRITHAITLTRPSRPLAPNTVMDAVLFATRLIGDAKLSSPL